MIKRTWMIPLFSLALSCAASAQTPSPDQRAFDTEQKMTDDERFAMLFSLMGVNGVIQVRDPLIPARAPMSAGYVSGVPRLGVPALIMSDGSLGITNPGYREGDTATALPAGLMLGSSFNPQLARAAGAMLGREARSRGFNVQLAGGTNPTRDPRNGRNYEYLSEDPWHSAVLAAETINGIQSEGVISTIKHYTLNVNETNRHWLNAIIDPAALRESDLLAFQIAIERSQPGAIMCGYNKVNGEADCGNNHLLNDVLKRDWGYKGWVMSDWGATQNWDFALKGLDQESGAQFDKMMWGDEYFADPLKQAYAQGKLPKQRLSDMVRRMLRSIYAGGVDQWGPSPKVDMASDNQIALDIARQGIVLLKNEGVLPLAADTTARIAVIGGYAQLGVPTGAGSSAVLPPGGYAAVVAIGGSGIMAGGRNLYLLPSSPLTELKKLLPKAQIEFDPGQNPAEAALLARRSDVVIVLGVRVESEGFDSPSSDLALGAGRSDQGRCNCEPEHDRLAGNRQPGDDAVERQREGDHSSLVPRTSGRPGDFGDHRRQGESFGPPSHHVSRGSGANPAPEARRSGHAVGQEFLQLRQRRRWQEIKVAPAGHDAGSTNRDDCRIAPWW